jgi:sporulation protein YlmC with PRC-barrel domain
MCLVSVAGLVGVPVRDPDGAAVGRVADLVVRWDRSRYPALHGLVARVARRRVFVPWERVAELGRRTVRLSSAPLDSTGFERRDGELALMADVIDHQMVDVDGVRVMRASDLYLTLVGDAYRVVAVDVGFHSLLRRLGPARWRGRPTPGRVIDWATIESFGGPGAITLRRLDR